MLREKREEIPDTESDGEKQAAMWKETTQRRDLERNWRERGRRKNEQMSVEDSRLFFTSITIFVLYNYSINYTFITLLLNKD